MSRLHAWFALLALAVVCGALLLTASITRAATSGHPAPATSAPPAERTVYARLATTGSDASGLPGVADGSVVLVTAASEALATRALRLGVTLALVLGVAGSVVARTPRGRALAWRRKQPDPAPRTQDADLGTRVAEPTTEPTTLGAPDSARRTAPTRAGETATASCARAVAAAFVYNRAATLAAFATAIGLDPDVNPAAAPGFWEMPASGHADLARAYLRHGRQLDARSVLTVALLTFRHNRELEGLLHDTTYRLAS